MLATQKQQMRVPSVRHALAMGRHGGQAIALDDGHMLDVIGQHACRDQAGHASTDDDGMAAPYSLYMMSIRSERGHW